MDFSNLSYFRVDIREVELLVAIMTFIIAAFFGMLAFLSNPKSWTHRFFAMLVLVFNSYTVINYISLHLPTPDDQLFWVRLVMFVSSFMGPLLLLFVCIFPSDKISLKIGYLVSIIGLAVVTAFFSLTSLVFKSMQYTDGVPLPMPGVGMPVFLVDFAGLILLSFILVILKYRKSQGKEKGQWLYLMNGIITSFSLIAVVTVLSVVVLKTSNFVFLGPVFFVVLIASIGMAVVRYQLFNIKIIATNILVVTLWIVLFSKLFVGEKSLVEMGVDLLVLGLIVIFGILIIKSIKREVEQREKLEKLTKELGSANVKLKELDKVKSEFLSFASHQVKTPMAVVKGYASLIIDGTYGIVSDKIRDTALKIKETADSMISLVNNLLDLRKIESGKMDFKFAEVDLVKLIKDMVEELRGLAQKKGLELSLETMEDKIICIADSQKLMQVFQNLIDNSIKYTEKGWIKVKIVTRDRIAQVSISDSGRGMSKELLPQLFEQFIRDAREIKKIEGTGLGLYIARQIVQAHHGKIWAESMGTDQGSTFCVELPF